MRKKAIGQTVVVRDVGVVGVIAAIYGQGEYVVYGPKHEDGSYDRYVRRAQDLVKV